PVRRFLRLVLGPSGASAALPPFPTRRSSDLFAYAIVTLGAFITGKSIKSQLAGFPLVFLLTIGALILSGNLFLKELGLETVIFRSEEHTSELQSRENLVCRLLLEKK